MGTRMPAVGLIILGSLALSCSTDILFEPGDTPDHQRKVSTPFTLEFGETGFLETENLEITFTSILGDSRCPSDVICVWEGVATIKLRLIVAAGDTYWVNLDSFGEGWTGGDPLPPTRDTLGFRIAFLHLDPYPVSTGTIPDSEYVATLAVFPFTPAESVDGEIQFSDDPPGEIILDGWDFVKARIAGETLELEVAHSGGCREHTFDLYMAPAVFLESTPVQANLYLRHDADGDPCRAYLRRVPRFDLRPVAQLHQILYGTQDCILLNLFAQGTGGQLTHAARLLYIPADASPSPLCVWEETTIQ